ncbi:CpsB/CapC family capsule biosynthesis tyrosine phosphatase [Pelosinus sp. IPA-1]|uniref:tyrosine-protein phosphatase n=1 Tax=Pelosinus sp. IPA-1 TaxID=3029569 RepID=UPI0024362747|nr:CpsB/CapC family capsule biosynthesis tyrosine phosphatase [Pelosinus sp. IPA-1]GMB01648.1 exopolysaccharide biosynthesis protein [Pelosinus sp. IPA-1]
MFDLHSHILPAMDDGAKDMGMSLGMLQMAVDNGTKGIVATPHVIEGKWLPTWDRVIAECNLLRETALAAGIKIPIFPGGEIAIHLDILDLLKGPGAYCINGGQYILLELPAAHIPNFIDDFLFTLQARGITPIIAHPERHPDLGKNPEILVEWINRGVLTQVNGTSITGHMGKRVMVTAELFLMNKMVHILGSDAHSEHKRNTDLKSAVARMKQLIGPEATWDIIAVNPENILSGRDINIPEVDEIKINVKNKGIMKWIAGLWR